MGSFGNVYKGKWMDSNVAIKELNDSSNEEQLDDFLCEAHLMASLVHPNTLRLYGVVQEGGYTAIVVEYMMLGSLDSYLEDIREGKREILRQDQTYKIIKEAATGVKFLHSKNVIHRDLAARNVLLDGTLRAVISDFGMAR